MSFPAASNAPTDRPPLAAPHALTPQGAAVMDKLAVLADAAKYDASCASSAAPKRSSLGGAGVGSTEGAGICHAYTPDGRCVSLLKILLTNYCMFDCAYCVNRLSSNVRRARFSVEEVVDLTIGFYKRNYIEGLFLSSGIIRSPDETMAEMVRVARSLRLDHDFRGYIHLKTIPDAAPELLAEAGLYADRLSINVELPGDQSLKTLAPEKDAAQIRRAMARMKLGIDEAADEARTPRAAAPTRRAPARRFAPAGQSTQMIVGADAAGDVDILSTSVNLYAGYGLKRVYYSAYSPIPDSSRALPPSPPPLMREHRLYQADWMLRFYGYSLGEIAQAATHGMLDEAIDPKLAWALKNRAFFPIDLNAAPKEALLRVPGIGPKAVKRLLAARRHQRLRLDDVRRISGSVRRAQPFIIVDDWRPRVDAESGALRAALAAKPAQLELFA